MCQPAANRIAGHPPDDLAILTKFTRMCHQTIAVAPKWCHSDAMDLTPYVDNLRHELAVAAEAGGEDAKALADRLTAPLESAVRLTLLDALSAAAAEITRDLAPPGSVDLRLRGREPEFVVAPAISEPVPAPPVEEDPTPAPRPPVTESDDASMTRINCGWGKTSKTGSSGGPGSRYLRQRVAGSLGCNGSGRRREQKHSETAHVPRFRKLQRLGALTPASSFAPPSFINRDNLIGSITMPTFSTPDPPITLNFDVAVAHIRITASSRNDTVVEVLPSNSSREVDVRVAEQTRVEFAGGRLQIKTPKQRGLGIFGKAGSVDISVQLPSGSELEGTAAVASLRSEGTLGRSRVKVSAGDCTLETTGPLNVSTGGAGAIIVEHVAGDIDTSTGSGSIRIGRVDGNAEVKNSNGDINIGTITGALKAKTANGSVAVEHAESDASAATANGDIRFETIESGVVSAKTAAGRIHIGVRSGTAARFDAHTSFGRVDNQMNATHGPASTERRVDVRAHTSYGDIVIRRSEPEKNPTRRSSERNADVP